MLEEEKKEEVKDKKKDSDEDEDFGGDINAEYESKRKKRTKEEISKELLEKGELYEILGLGDRKDATTKDIVKAYKKTALKYHPDKIGEGNMTEELKELWLKV